MSSPARRLPLPRTPPLRQTLRGWLCAALLALQAMPLAARCVDEESLDAWVGSTGDAQITPADPRVTLSNMVRDAIDRSHALGASRLLAEAAESDIEETRAAKAVQASLGGGLGPALSYSPGITESSPMQLRAALNVSQMLYDGGRTDRLTDWRTQLAESARYGHLTQREQIALNTVALALERSRWRQQVRVYGQYQRKMACLVEALETIVRADRGRASELVQARKSQQQAEIAQAQALSQVRQVEVRLRRLVGDGLPGTEGLSSVLLQVASLEALVADVERSTELAQLAAQAAAARQYAQAVAAGGRPQVSWSITGAGSAGNGSSSVEGRPYDPRNGTLALGVAVNIPLLAPGIAPATDAARKRAEAAVLQRAEALEARRYRVAEVFEQTQSSFDRARRVGAVLRDSEQVRHFTLQQWQQLGKRSLFDVMGAEAEHYNLRINYVNALHDGQQLNANLLSLGRGVSEWLR